MAIDYDKLLSKLSPIVWYTGKELDELWGVEPEYRKSRVAVLVKDKRLKRRGKTSNIQYHLSGVHNPKKKKKTKTKKGSSLDSLIHATTAVGTENEILKKALTEIKAITDNALENIV